MTVTVLNAQGPGRAPRAGDLDRVEIYLEKLGAPGLIGRLLEREIDRIEANGDDPGPLINRLAMNYATQLRTLDTDGRKAIEARLAALLQAHPEANTLDLQIARLEDQFNQGELMALRWIDEPDDGIRDAAREILIRVMPELRRRRDELLDRVAQGNEQLDRLGGDANQHANLERQVLHESELAGRATYYAGWAALYSNWLEPTGVGGLAGFREARLSFKRLLGLEVEDVVDDPFDLHLDNASQARVLLGLGLAELAIGEIDAGRDAFRVLRMGQTNPSVRDWLDFWEAAALLKIGRTAEARQLAESTVLTLPSEATPGRAAFCKLLIRSGKEAPAIGPIGLHGLVRMNQFDLARGLLRAHPIPPESVGGMLGQWLHGLEILDRAELNRNPADYEEAIGWFRKATEHPEAEANPALSAVCLYAIGCCQLRLDQVNEASETLHLAVKGMKAASLAETVDAEWMTALADYRKARTPDEKEQAGETFRQFASRYPRHPNTAIVPGILARIAESLPKPSNKTDPTAVESCRRLYSRWKELPADARRSSPLSRELSEILERVDRDDLPDSDRLELDLMRADLALSADPPGIEPAGKAIDRAMGRVSSLPENSTQRLDLAEIRLKWARLAGHEIQLREVATELAERGKGTPTEVEARSALAVLADRVHRRSPSDATKRAEAREAYRKLLGLLGESPEQWKTNKALVGVALRLAELEVIDGAGDSAQKRVESLMAAYPNDAGMLERSARVLAKAGRPDRALEAYRTLMGGLEEGSDLWFAATIGRLECLERIDHQRAREAFARFRRLHPESSWPERRSADLERLKARLE